MSMSHDLHHVTKLINIVRHGTIFGHLNKISFEETISKGTSHEPGIRYTIIHRVAIDQIGYGWFGSVKFPH